jgi:hypothetical protein
MKSLEELTEKEILALAISSDEEDGTHLRRFRGRIARRTP